MTDEEGQTSEVNFYPRPPRGGRQALALKTAAGQEFLSTPSARRATTPIRTACTCGRISIHALREEGDSCLCRLVWRLEISIHALREEGDGTFAGLLTCPRYFYPRPPRGGRLESMRPFLDENIFLSTPSARRATLHLSQGASLLGNFYPRPPRGGRPVGFVDFLGAVVFLSTPSARRATCRPAALSGRLRISIHALREEGDTMRMYGNI